MTVNKERKSKKELQEMAADVRRVAAFSEGFERGLAAGKTASAVTVTTTTETTHEVELEIPGPGEHPTGLAAGPLCWPSWTVLPPIKQIIYNPPATVVIWADGTKTVVKCREREIYNHETGLAMAIARRAFGRCAFKRLADSTFGKREFWAAVRFAEQQVKKYPPATEKPSEGLASPDSGTNAGKQENDPRFSCNTCESRRILKDGTEFCVYGGKTDIHGLPSSRYCGHYSPAGMSCETCEYGPHMDSEGAWHPLCEYGGKGHILPKDGFCGRYKPVAHEGEDGEQAPRTCATCYHRAGEIRDGMLRSVCRYGGTAHDLPKPTCCDHYLLGSGHTMTPDELEKATAGNGCHNCAYRIAVDGEAYPAYCYKGGQIHQTVLGGLCDDYTSGSGVAARCSLCGYFAPADKDFPAKCDFYGCQCDRNADACPEFYSDGRPEPDPPPAPLEEMLDPAHLHCGDCAHFLGGKCKRRIHAEKDLSACHFYKDRKGRATLRCGQCANFNERESECAIDGEFVKAGFVACAAHEAPDTDSGEV